MTDKIDLALKIKERVISRNISLNSLKGLPEQVINNLQYYLQNVIILHRGIVSRAKIEVISEKILQIHNLKNLQLKPQEIIIIVLPYELIKYVFFCKVINIYDNYYEVFILDPRSDERIILKDKTPAFLSLIPKEFIKNILDNNEYFLLRESNISSENYHSLTEVVY